MTPDELKKRTKLFGLRIIRLNASLPRNRTAEVIGRQILRSGTSVGANYRSACRARSNADFISKMNIVEEEIDESAYWMEMLVDAGLVKPKLLQPLQQEAKELLAITVASINTARGRPRGTGVARTSAVRRKSAIRNPQSAIDADQPGIRNHRPDTHG
jgi:four helix bundle protein